MTNSLSKSELRALAYFVVGVSSEGNLGGRDVSNRLSFAGKWGDKMYPVANSGVSVGTLQKDLGQDKGAMATALVASFQAWAQVSDPESMLPPAAEQSAIDDLSRNGNTIVRQGHRPLDTELKTKINEFLKSGIGKDFVHRSDLAEVETIYEKALTKLAAKPLYQRAPREDQIKLAAVVAKVFNQNRKKGLALLDVMDSDASGQRLYFASDVLDHTSKFMKPMLDGRDLALKGAEIYTRLHSIPVDHPLRQAWEEVLKDPLIPPSRMDEDRDRIDFAAQYTVIKNLFLDPTNSMRFLRAIEQGADHRFGRAHAVENHRATAGYFASGPDFVQWNADGKGVAYVGGGWSHVARDDVSLRKHPDGTVELVLEREGVSTPLLHVGTQDVAHERTLDRGMHGDDVHAIQSSLARLGYTDAQGRPLQPDGDFGNATHAAVQAFQRDHALAVDGRVGRGTMEMLDRVVAGMTPLVTSPDFSYLRHDRGADPASAYRDLAPAPTPGLVAPEVRDDPDVQAMRTLQQQLNTLGMTDMNREPLVADGAYGPHTQAALARFQHSHALPVTGAPDDTTQSMLESQAFIAELARASGRVETFAMPTMAPVAHGSPSHSMASQRKPGDPSDPNHPDHALNRDIREGVRALYASEGLTLSSQQLDNVAAALMADARAYGVDRVHLVEFGEGGRSAEDARIIVYSRDPDDVHCNECSVDARQAMAMPTERSYEEFEQVKQQQVTQELAFEEQRSLSQQQGRSMSLH